MFKKRSTTLLICNLLSTAYLVYIFYNLSAILPVLSLSETIKNAYILYMFAMGIGIFLEWISFAFKISWAALIGALLYLVAPFVTWLILDGSIYSMVIFGFNAEIFIVYNAQLFILGIIGFITQNAKTKKFKFEKLKKQFEGGTKLWKNIY